jgi:hypothetical protein
MADPGWSLFKPVSAAFAAFLLNFLFFVCFVSLGGDLVLPSPLSLTGIPGAVREGNHDEWNRNEPARVFAPDRYDYGGGDGRDFGQAGFGR